MTRQRLFKIGAAVACVILAALIATKSNVGAQLPIFYRAQSSNALSQEKPQREMTLVEVWNIFETRAKLWQPDSGIVSIASVDTPGDSRQSGQDGRRRAWVAVFASSKQPARELTIKLVDGTIVEETEQSSAYDSSLFLVKPQVDSPQALKLALAAKPNLKPATKNSYGYNFILERMPDTPSAIRVLAAHKGKPALLSLNSETGKILSAQIYGFAPVGGIMYSTDTGVTWEASNLTDKMVTAISANPENQNGAFATVSENNHIHFYESQDNGRTWNKKSKLPKKAGDYGSEIRVLTSENKQKVFLASTWSGVWISRDSQVWSRIEALPKAPAGWIGIAKADDRFRVFVTITGGKNVGLYASNDLTNWTRISKVAYRLSESFDNRSVLATSEAQPEKSLLLQVDIEQASIVPGTVLHAAGDFANPDSMLLIDTLSRVGQLSNKEIKQTLAKDGAIVAASPTFDQDKTAIVFGFQSGIFRTTDGGHSWEQVLDDASAIVSGTNEIGAAVFLSKSSVIAANGGYKTWIDF